jgi:hypothetical protein
MKRVLLLCFVLMISAVVFGQESEDDNITVTDGLQHRVPLEEVIIDDFSNFSDPYLPLSRADRDDILKARNRLRPFCVESAGRCFSPAYEGVEAANQWLAADNSVIGYVAEDGQPYAFPFRLLSFHGLINDVLAEQPILVVYCAYCNSAAVYSRTLNGETLEFGNTSTFYQSLLTMFDRQSESLWLMVNGQAIVGDRTGEQLEQLPAIITTWERWTSLHPETQVLARREGYVDYSQDLFSDYRTRLNLNRFPFPVSEELLEDERLRFGEQVVVLSDEAMSVAYPLSAVTGGVIHDTFSDDSIVVLSADEEKTAATYYAELEDGSTLDLEYEPETGNWLDTNTQSLVNINGQVISGPLQGQTLTPYLSGYMYWFAAAVIYPDIRIHE